MMITYRYAPTRHLTYGAHAYARAHFCKRFGVLLAALRIESRQSMTFASIVKFGPRALAWYVWRAPWHLLWLCELMVQRQRGTGHRSGFPTQCPYSGQVQVNTVEPQS